MIRTDPITGMVIARMDLLLVPPEVPVVTKIECS